MPFNRTSGALILALVVLAAACSDGPEVTAGQRTSPIAGFLGEEDTEFISALGMGERWADEAEMAATTARLQRVQEEIAACMKEKGFEYVPHVRDDLWTSGDDLYDDGPAPGTREYAQKWGFGVSTRTYPQDTVGPDLLGHSYLEQTGEAGQGPNDAYVASLDDAEREAYDRAYVGDNSEGRVTGCVAAYTDGGANDFYTEFGDQLDAIRAAAIADPRVVEAYSDLNRCLSGEGFERFDPAGGGPWALFIVKVEELGFDVGSQPAAELTAEEVESLSAEEIDELTSAPVPLSIDDRAMLRELQDEEIAYAVAAHDCGGAALYSPPDEVLEVFAAYEQQFLDDNADALEPFRDAAAT